VDAAVSPRAVLPGKAEHQHADGPHRGRSTDPLRARDTCVTCRDQVAVPAQYGLGSHQQPDLARHGAGESVQQCGEQCSISGGEPNPVAVQLALKDGDLVAEGQDCGVLAPGRSWAAALALPAHWIRRGRPIETARPSILAYPPSATRPPERVDARSPWHRPNGLYQCRRRFRHPQGRQEPAQVCQRFRPASCRQGSTDHTTMWIMDRHLPHARATQEQLGSTVDEL
jgi:hypothetical protein